MSDLVDIITALAAMDPIREVYGGAVVCVLCDADNDDYKPTNHDDGCPWQRAKTSSQWTREPPTAPGWYWAKLRAEELGVMPVWFAGLNKVVLAPGIRVNEIGVDNFDSWCGPITPPELPR